MEAEHFLWLVASSLPGELPLNLQGRPGTPHGRSAPGLKPTLYRFHGQYRQRCQRQRALHV